MANKKLLLIDGDQVVYQITSALEQEVPVGPTSFEDSWMYEGHIALLTDPVEVSKAIESKIADITADFDDYILCFTSTPNFRHERLKSYKGGRLKKRKPLCYWTVVRELVDSDTHDTRKYPGLEADDVMSIIATHPDYLRRYYISIHSNDKDMKQVFHTPIITDSGTHVMSEYSANHFRYTQCLAGDITDGYKGVKSVGPRKAKSILDGLEGECESVYIDVVIEVYRSAGYTLEEAYSQIDCACILRYGEYDIQNRKPILIEERING